MQQRSKRRWRTILFGLCLLLCGAYAAGQANEKNSLSVEVRGPTVIAFCEPISDAQIEKDPNLADMLSDFQLYASRAGVPLRKAGIRFEVLSARSFAVVTSGHTKEFHPRISVGYYFIAPGREPRIEYGVRTDPDILQFAREYFGIPVK